MAEKPTVTVGEATKKTDYDNLVDFLCMSETLDGDAGYTLTTNDFGKIVKVDSSSNRTVNLPSISGTDRYGWFGVVRFGTGKVTIQRADSDTIHYHGRSYISFSDFPQFSIVFIRLISATKWAIVNKAQEEIHPFLFL